MSTTKTKTKREEIWDKSIKYQHQYCEEAGLKKERIMAKAEEVFEESVCSDCGEIFDPGFSCEDAGVSNAEEDHVYKFNEDNQHAFRQYCVVHWGKHYREFVEQTKAKAAIQFEIPKDDLIKQLKLLAVAPDWDQLCHDGILERINKKKFRVPDMRRLPDYLGARVLVIGTDSKRPDVAIIEFEDCTRWAQRQLAKLGLMD